MIHDKINVLYMYHGYHTWQWNVSKENTCLKPTITASVKFSDLQQEKFSVYYL